MQPNSSLGHLPDEGARWAFDASVTECFDDMLARSIPDYLEMRRLVTELGLTYVRPSSDVVDLGCSRGEALAPFVERAPEARSFVGVEVSEPMLEAARARFSGLEAPRLLLLPTDLRRDFPNVVPSLVLSVLTLQFIPIEYRQQVVQRVYDALLPGGAFLLVEKVLGASSGIDDTIVREYLRLKAAHGYSSEEIARKRLALEGVLVPITAEWNESMLKRAGFSQVDCFWRWCNFAGWVAVKAPAPDR
jgi:tRNA (cmo5U34)-methyltransferase